MQGRIEAAIAKTLGFPVTLYASGRTDAGVHARGQCAHFDAKDCVIPPEKWAYILNNALPPDISVSASCAVPDSFHARVCARGKTYRYLLRVSAAKSALTALTHWTVAPVLDVASMRRAAACLVGTHSFASFQSAGSTAETDVRTVTQLDLACEKEEGGSVSDGEIVLTISADGFLYNMVRVITAQLVRVGRGEISAEDFKGILEARDRAGAKLCAPPQGLTLMDVLYP